MKITRFVVAAALLLAGGVASAQQSKSDETLEFRPHWSIGVQAGAAYTLGEADFGKMISPAAALNFQWQFHHAFGLRLGVGGWQGKGAYVATESVYPFQFAGANVDVTMDLTSLIGGFDHKRICSAYIFGGVGASYGFNNKSAEQYKEQLRYYWTQKFFVPGRFGLGVDFRLGEVVSLGLEGVANVYSDHLNSKRADNADWQMGLLAGIKFNLGKNTRPSTTYVEKAAVEEAASAAAMVASALAVAEAQKAAADNEAALKAAEQNAAEARAELAKAIAAKEAAEHALEAARHSQEVYFLIGSAVIRKNEDAKLVHLAKWMNENPEYTVIVVGYSDKETGTAAGNLVLSEKRAKAVTERLIELGVDKAKIESDHKGDTVQPFHHNDNNRVVICTLK